MFFTVAQWKGPFFNGQGHIGSCDSLLCYLQVQLRQMTIDEHANVGLPRVILFNKVAAFNSIKLPLLPSTETCERAIFTIFCQLQEEILKKCFSITMKNTNVCYIRTRKLLINEMMPPV